MSGEKSSNIVGVPFKKYVREQIGLRALQGSTDKRSSDQIMYLANKNCWIRLVSFVNVISDEKIKEERDYLARNWALFGGTSVYTKDINKVSTIQGLRYGIENISQDTSVSSIYNITSNSAYGLGGTSQYGYRPMPGITSATIEHAGTAGSLRISNVKFKVWNINQLNIIDTLYFRLGYSCLLEWGHSSYLDNTSKTLQTIINPIDIFNENLIKTKEDVIRKINEKRKETSGNYDAMYGLISNYDWSQSSDGGYECNVKLTGLGSVIDSLKINQAYSMPGGAYKSSNQTTNDNIIQNLKPETESNAKVLYPFISTNKKFIVYPQLGTIIKLYTSKEYPQDTFDKNSVTSVYLNSEYIKQNPPDIIEIGYIVNKIKYTGVNNQKTGLEKGEFKVNLEGLQKISNELSTNFFDPKLEWLPVLTYINEEYYLSFIIEIPLKTSKIFEIQPGTNALASREGYNLDNKIKSTEIFIRISTKRNEKADAFSQDPAINYIDLTNESAKSVANLDQEALKINQPALLQFYYKYLSGNFITLQENTTGGKYQSTTEDLKGISLVLKNITPGYSKKTENRLSIGITITLSDENPATNRAAKRIQVIKEYLNKVYTTIYTQTTDVRKVVEITPIIDNNLFNAKDYITINNNVSKVFSVANIEYNYDYNKLINESNAEQGAPTPALNTVQSTIPYIVMSNIDKFLIELRDKVLETDYIDDDEIYAFIEYQLKNGVLDNIRTSTLNEAPTLTSKELTKLNTQKQLGVFIKKGFNSEIISGEVEELSKVKDVDFKELFKAYRPGLYEDSTVGKTSKFVYIKLGLLLYYINNSSLFYEKPESVDDKNISKDTNKKPFIYIDFNPNTNYCLTTKYHFSVDPGVCLIPVNITPEGYDKLFQGINIEQDKTKFSVEDDNISPDVQTNFSPKNDLDESRGNIMNIAINIDHVLNILLRQTKGNPKSDVLLRSFLETLMEDINKSMGNINMFRVGYYDEGNTVRIYDDQVINAPSGQETINNKNNSLIVPETIPIVGKNSILRSLDIKTEASTKMSQMIAFSAQAGNFGALNTDSSGLGNLNTSLIDRLLPVKEISTNIKEKNDTTPADDSAANIFIGHVRNIYYSRLYSNTNVDVAINYYSTAANKLKAEDKYTTAKPVLPISVNLTMDGISGLSILEGFTIPTDLLPERYKNNDGTSKVGFAIVGLNHNIDNNQWVTGIKGQMINIPNPINVSSSELGTISTRTSTPKKLNNIKTSYPEKPFVSYKKTYLKQSELAKYLKEKVNQGLNKNIAIAVLAKAISEQGDEDGINLRGFNNNFYGVQTDSNRWGTIYDQVITGNVILPEGKTKKIRAYAAFDTPFSGADFMISVLKKRGIYIGGKTSNITRISINNINDWVNAYYKEWVRGDKNANPDSIFISTRNSIYRRAENIINNT